jgi:phospholipid/cholesterol/gamma-HCH transport system ATP-binding protein
LKNNRRTQNIQVILCSTQDALGDQAQGLDQVYLLSPPMGAFLDAKHTPAVLRRLVEMKLHAVGLLAAADAWPRELSGGMARRVALARAVVLEPELVLYDEPFAGLDPISLGITARLIRSLSDRLGCASVVITHDIAESFAIADHVYLVGQGELKAHGTPATLGASTDPYVQQFLHGHADGPVAFDYPVTPAFEAWLARTGTQA